PGGRLTTHLTRGTPSRLIHHPNTARRHTRVDRRQPRAWPLDITINCGLVASQPEMGDDFTLSQEVAATVELSNLLLSGAAGHRHPSPQALAIGVAAN